jgi:hypothetical protein
MGGLEGMAMGLEKVRLDGMTEENALLGEVPSCIAGISGDRIAPPLPTEGA